jgi:capsular exopolysaccharide synthesis family protein
LVDCDLRKPEIHTMLNIERSPGVADIIGGECSLSDLIKRPVIDNLFVLPAGSIASNPSEILRHPEAKELFEKLKSLFDYVIVDTSPVIPVSDSRIVGSMCDAVIVLARSERTSKKAVKEAFWLLEAARAKPVACILTDFQAPFYSQAGYPSYYKK